MKKLLTIILTCIAIVIPYFVGTLFININDCIYNLAISVFLIWIAGLGIITIVAVIILIIRLIYIGISDMLDDL